MKNDLRRAFNDGVLALEIEDILQVLPHRPPVLLVDRVMTLVPGSHAVAMKAVTGNECGLAGRRRGFTFPSTFALEALVQVATLVILSGDPGHEDSPPSYALRLTEVESLKIEQEMATGDLIYLHVSISLGSEGEYRTEGHAELNGKTYVRTTFCLQRIES